MRALALALALSATVSACKKEDSGGDPIFVDPTKVWDSTANQVDEPKVVNEVRFHAYVAWDPVAGEIVKPVIDGNPDDYISAYIITLYETGWTAEDDSTWCEVVVDLTGMTASPDAKTEGFAWGLDIPSGPKEGYESCTGAFDVEAFVDGWKVEDWQGYAWNLRFYSALSADLEEWLTPDTPPTDFDINHYTGGGWSTPDGGLETDADSNYWRGYAMDDLHNVDFDTRLDARFGMVDGNGDMMLGYYVFDQNVFWDNVE